MNKVYITSFVISSVGLMAVGLAMDSDRQTTIPSELSYLTADSNDGEQRIMGMQSASEQLLGSWNDRLRFRKIAQPVFSRGGRRSHSEQKFAEVFFDPYQPHSDSYFTGTLKVVPESQRDEDDHLIFRAERQLAFVFNRQTGLTSIYSDGDWQPYQKWLQTNLVQSNIE